MVGNDHAILRIGLATQIDGTANIVLARHERFTILVPGDDIVGHGHAALVVDGDATAVVIPGAPAVAGIRAGRVVQDAVPLQPDITLQG